MSQSYEELTGGEGPAVNYRPPRYRLRALVRQVDSQLEVDGEPVQIGDISATGLSYLTSCGPADPGLGADVAFKIRLGGHEAAAGRAQIVRVEEGEKATRVAIHFLDRLVLPRRIAAIGADSRFEEAIARGVSTFEHVPPEYREACGHAQAFLAYWQGLLDAREAELRDEDDDVEARCRSAEEAALAKMREEWVGIRQRAGTVADEIEESSPAYAAARALSAVQLAPFVERSPFLQRCRAKPRGYPGDYQLMRMMYAGERLADTIFGRALDQLGLDEHLAATLPSRRDALVEVLRRRLSEAIPTTRPLRILNIGSGPAREMSDWLGEIAPGPSIELVLVDQDAAALAYAQEQLAAVAMRHEGRVRVICRHLSFKQLFAEPQRLAELVECDLVYSAGLFDYLREAPASLLIQQCFELLDVGGRLLVGNAAKTPVAAWVPEYLLDWKMIYRTPAEMRRLGKPFSERAKIELGADSSGAWHMLSMTRQR
jgi:extracellular factor (EF) 3-hydroxypalmitic acid methyl ester biosynthesis protein